MRQQSKRLSKSVREIGHEVEDEEEARVDANAGRMSRAQAGPTGDIRVNSCTYMRFFVLTE